jgi:hypothetical protein
MKDAIETCKKSKKIIVSSNEYLDRIISYLQAHNKVKAARRRHTTDDKNWKQLAISIEPEVLQRYMNAIDRMLNVKNMSCKSLEEADVEVHVVSEMLHDLNAKTIAYLNINRVSVIQAALIDIQGADQATVLKRIDDLEELLLREIAKNSNKQEVRMSKELTRSII